VNWFVFCYWFEPDAPRDPVGLVRIWAMAEALVRAGDRVTLFPPRYRSSLVPRSARVRPVPLVHCSLMRPFSYLALSFLLALWEAVTARPDIIYYRWMVSPHPLIVARLLGARCVCEVNGEPIPEWSDSGAGWLRKLKHGLARWAFTRCDGIVVLTEGLKQELVHRYAVPAERITLLPSGTDTELFTPREAMACRREVGMPQEGPCIGFVGSFYRYQGLQCLLQAMTIVRQACPAARLLLVGDGEAAMELKAQAARLGLTSSIQWAGRVAYERVPYFIGAMTVCVAPFRGDRGETSPVKIFDYLACGRPVVASALPCVEAAFTVQRGVQFVPPDDPALLARAIMALLSDPAACAAMGTEGRRFVERRFSWTHIVAWLRMWLQETEAPRHHAHSRLL
jgi:glycosyltransferase involved in cell wall biosynthesis